MAVDNLKIEQQIQALLKERQGMLETMNDEYREMVGIASALQDALEGADVGDLADKVIEVKTALQEATQAATGFGSATESAVSKTNRGFQSTGNLISDIQKLLKDKITTYGKLGVIGYAAVNSLTNTFTGLVSVVQNLGNVLIGAIGWMFKLGKSILAIPFRIFDLLVEDANAMQNLFIEVARAWEEVRKEFGDFAEKEGAAVGEVIGNAGAALQKFGLSTTSVLGWLDEPIKNVLELLKHMGPALQNWKERIGEAAGEFLIFVKGMGVADEHMQGFFQRAQRDGKDFMATFHAVGNMAIQLGDKFGISQKVISRDVGRMMKNIETFGSVGEREMVQLSVYARRLSVDFEELLGVTEKFDNFEDAAVNAAKMSQAFGANIDVMGIMREQDPAAMVEELRRSMAAAGQDSSKFSRQQRKLLMDLTGMSAAAVDQTFALNNQTKSYKEIQEEGAKAEKQQLKLEDVLAKLADAVERILKEGHELKGGFFDMMVRGFRMGVRQSGPYREMLKEVMVGLRSAFQAGRELGKLFVTQFPGISKIFKGIAAVIRDVSGRFQAMASVVSEFFRSVGPDGQAAEGATNRLLTRLADIWKDFFSSGGVKIILDGMKTLGAVILKGLTGAIPFVMKGMTTVFKFMADFINNPGKVVGGLRPGSMGDSIAKMFSPLGKAIAANWPALWNSLQKLFDAVWKKAKPYLKTAMYTLFVAFVGGVVIKGAITTLGGLIAKHLTKMLLGGADDAAAAVARGGMFSKLLGKVFPIAAIVTSIAAMGSGMKEFGPAIEEALGPGSEVESKIGGATAGLIKTFTLGLVPDDIAQQIGLKIGEISQALFDALTQQFGGEFTGKLKAMIEPAFDFFGTVSELIGAIFEGDKGKIGDIIVKGMSQLGEFIVTGLDFLITQALPMLLKYGGKLVGGLAEGIVDAASKVVGMIGDSVEDVPVIGPLVRMIQAAIDVIGGAVTVIKNLLIGIGKWILGEGDPFKGFMDAMDAWGGKIWKFFGKVFGGVVDIVEDVLSAIISVITYPFEKAWEFIKSIFSPNPGNIVKMFEKTVGVIKDTFASGLRQITNKWKAIERFFSGLVSGVQTQFRNMKTGILNIVKGMWEAVLGRFNSAKGKIHGAMKAIMKFIAKPLIDFMQLIVDKLSKFLPDEWAKSLSGMITSAKKTFEISSPSKVFTRMGQNIVDGLDAGLKGMPQMGEMRVKQTISGMNALQEETAKRAIKIKAKLKQQFGDSRLTDDGKLVLERPKEIIQVSFNVSMDTDDVRTNITGQRGARIVTERPAIG